MTTATHHDSDPFSGRPSLVALRDRDLDCHSTDMQLVGEASTGKEAVQLHRELNPDVTLMDLQMPDMSGLDAITAIRSEDPTARIIVLTTYSGMRSRSGH
jgi:DNA-binding NarL/FixJ family response regulator